MIAAYSGTEYILASTNSTPLHDSRLTTHAALVPGLPTQIRVLTIKTLPTYRLSFSMSVYVSDTVSPHLLDEYHELLTMFVLSTGITVTKVHHSNLNAVIAK